MKRTFCPIFLICAVLLSTVGNIYGQLESENEVFKRMLLHANQKGLSITKAGEYELTTICPGKRIKVSQSGNTITEMQLELFSQIPDKEESLPIFTFIERFLLDVLLHPTKPEQVHLLNSHFVELSINDIPFEKSMLTIPVILELITPDCPFLLKNDPHHIYAIWNIHKGAESIQLTFPKQYDLILGKDKKELVHFLIQDMKSFKYEKRNTPIDKLALQLTPVKDIFFDAGDTYLIPEMKNGKYIQKKDTTYAYLFNERFRPESLLNIFSNADEMDWEGNITIDIRGYKLSEIVPYTTGRLCGWMKNDNCKAYVGIETDTVDEITGTVVYVNTDLMYKHLLYFKFPREAFKRKEISITGQLFPYIPLNNLTNLYEDVYESNLRNQ